MIYSNQFGFYSKKIPILSLKKLYVKAAENVSSLGGPIGLLNCNGVAMLPDNYHQYEQIEIVMPHEDDFFITNQANKLDFGLPVLSDFIFLMLIEVSSACVGINDFLSKKYSLFVISLLRQFYKAFEDLFNACYEHLSDRHYDGIAIASISVVEQYLADAHILLNGLLVAINRIQNRVDLFHVFNLMSEFLLILIKLSGARSVLKEGVLELKVNLMIVQKFLV